MAVVVGVVCVCFRVVDTRGCKRSFCGLSVVRFQVGEAGVKLRVLTSDGTSVAVCGCGLKVEGEIGIYPFQYQGLGGRVVDQSASSGRLLVSRILVFHSIVSVIDCQIYA